MDTRTNTLAIEYVGLTTAESIRLPIDVFRKPRTMLEYEHLQATLDRLIDEVRDDENHPLEPAMQIIGENLEAYDDDTHPSIGAAVSPVDMVKHLMAEKHLHQKDIARVLSGNVA